MSTKYNRRSAMALGLGGVATLAGCGSGSRFLEYRGPRVTQVVVDKSSRKMLLLHRKTVLRSYGVQLGFTSNGHKRHYGDGRTPEGRYRIDRRNPNSRFFLSVGIDYPNARDRAWARGRGLDPGGDIFIHGWGDERQSRDSDWTAGCIAVTNREMRDVYAMVKTGTVVDILP